VTVAVAGGFVGILSMVSRAGRFVWSSTSDVVGRKPIYIPERFHEPASDEARAATAGAGRSS
jgi:hypothetical protein